MAKAKEEVTAVANWSPEDMGRLAEEIDALGKILTDLKNQFQNFQEWRIEVEKALVSVNIEDRTLPSEVIAGLSPGQIYTAALNAAITASLLAQPGVHNQPDRIRETHVRSALTYAELVLTELLKRTPGEKKK